jgi:hypothetical protein
MLITNSYKGKLNIVIKDLFGKTLRKYYIDKTEGWHSEEMELGRYGAGIYIIEVNYQEKKSTVKVVIEK